MRGESRGPRRSSSGSDACSAWVVKRYSSDRRGAGLANRCGFIAPTDRCHIRKQACHLYTSMDRFVIKRPREAEGTQDASKKPAVQSTVAGLRSIALCKPNQAIVALESKAVECFEKFSIDKWYNLGDYLHNRQLLFGPRPGSHRSPHDERIPDVILEIFKHARKSLLEEAPYFGGIPEKPSGCAINRYAPTSNGRGNGLGPHKDKGSWIPLVVGVTLVESRKMSFSNDYKTRATQRHSFTTEVGSVYGFRDEMYTRWYHESLKKGPTQKRTIYSITYRFLAS
jgi:hypothetical protein